MSFSGNLSRRVVIVVCPSTGDVSFDDLIKVVSASFLYYNFVINKLFVWRSFNAGGIHCFLSNFHPLV